MVPISYYVALSAILLAIGAVGVLVRKNLIVMFMSVELMLNAANLAFVAYTRYYLTMQGQVFVFLVMAVAAAEVAVGLSMVVAIFRSRHTVNVDEMNTLKG